MDVSLADVVILAALAISALISVFRGFFKEALSLLGWIAAFLVAKGYAPVFSQMLVEYIEAPLIQYIAAFGILFLVTLMICGIFSFVLTRLIRIAGLGVADRILGSVFGMARGVILITVGVMFLGHTAFRSSPIWQESKFIPHFELIAAWSLKRLPEVSGRVSDLNQWVEGRVQASTEHVGTLMAELKASELTASKLQMSELSEQVQTSP